MLLLLVYIVGRLLAHLAAVAQEVVGQHQGHHGLAHRNGPDSDAGVVAALGHHVDVFTLGRDAALGREDGRGGLDREAHHHVLARGNATQNAARIVGEEFRLAAPHADFIGVLFARKLGRLEAGANLHALHRVDAHEGVGDFCLEFVVDGLSQTNRHILRDDIDTRTTRVTIAAQRIHVGLKFGNDTGVCRKKWVNSVYTFW